jgi:lathosterol oxidase
MDESLVLFFKLTAIQFIRFLLFAGGAYLIFYVWKIKPFIQTGNISKIQLKHELKNSFISLLIIGFIFSMIFHPSFKMYTNVFLSFDDYPLWWNLLTIPLLILINDIYFYFMHRTLHHKYFYHRFHATHHVSTNPTPFATFSFHPIETILEVIWIIPVIYFIPIHRNLLILYATISFFNNLKGHLGVELGSVKLRNVFPFKWINTSTHHSFHHKYFNSNFGLYFLWWDRFFKTERRIN